MSALVGTIDWRTSTLAGDENQADKKETQVDRKEPAAENSGSEQPSRPPVPEGLFWTQCDDCTARPCFLQTLESQLGV